LSDWCKVFVAWLSDWCKVFVAWLSDWCKVFVAWLSDWCKVFVTWLSDWVKLKTLKLVLTASLLKNSALRSKKKYWIASSQVNVSEWSDMSSHRLLFQ
jgi:hypothetical protein